MSCHLVGNVWTVIFTAEQITAGDINFVIELQSNSFTCTRRIRIALWRNDPLNSAALPRSWHDNRIANTHGATCNRACKSTEV